MDGYDRVQRALLFTGLGISAFLLIRFAVDFGRSMDAALVIPFWILVILVLGVSVWNLLGARGDAAGKRRTGMSGGALMLSIPLAFTASSLDCTGLTVAGCTPFCTAVKTVIVPVLAAACVAYLVVPKRAILIGVIVVSLVPLAPHCVCNNVGNGWWIGLIGASPTCYSWGFAAVIVAVSAIAGGSRIWPSLAVNLAIIAGAMGFFVGHHFFRYPW